MDALVEAAKKEAELSTIALPDIWANYGEIKKAFMAKYPFLKHNDLNPEASSADEVEAIKANNGNDGPQDPDVIDVAFVFGKSSKKEGLLQPYKVATWDTIPASLKDPDGFWYGDYYGVMAFEVNNADCAECPAGLGRSAQARVQGPDRAGRRPDAARARRSTRFGRRRWATAARSMTPCPAWSSSRS